MAARWRTLAAMTAVFTLTGCAMLPVPQLPSLPDLPDLPRLPDVQLPWQRQDEAAAGRDDTGAPTPTPTPTDQPPPTTAPTATRTAVAAQNVPWSTQQAQPAQPTQPPQPAQQAPQGQAPITVPPTRQPPPPERGDCQPGDLDISFVADPSASGADYSAYLLWMTNISSSACEIAGFPGVDFAAGPSGLQVGRAGSWDRIYEPQRFSLAPGQRAAAEVRIIHASRLSNCQPTAVNYVKVIAPNTWTGYLFPLSVTACANPEVKQLSVRVSRKVG